MHPRAVEAFQILRHILRDARGHQGKVLVHSAQQGLVRGAVIRPDVAAVQPYFAAGRVVESTQQLHQRGFARAIQAYDGQLFAWSDGQIDVRKNIFFRARIAKGNVAQLQLARLARPERGRHFSAFQWKRFGIRPKFAYGGKLQALPVQRGEGRKDARDPCGEAADGRKVQQKFRHRQFARQNLCDEIGVGHSVARQGEQRIDGVGQKIAFAGARVEGMIGAPRAAKHLFNPGPHAENAQVFAQGGVFRLVQDVIHPLEGLFFLAAVAVAPAQDAMGAEKARRAGRQRYGHEQRIEGGEQRKI